MKNKNTKIILEIVLICTCIGYLLIKFLNKFENAATFILPITMFFTALEFFIKYVKEVYIYKNKHNVLKASFSIYSIYIMFLSFLLLLNKLNTIMINIYTASVIVYEMYMIYYVIINIKKLKNENKNLFLNVTKSFSTLLSLTILTICLWKFI